MNGGTLDFVLHWFPSMSGETLGWILVILAAGFEFLGVIGLKKYSEVKNVTHLHPEIWHKSGNNL